MKEQTENMSVETIVSKMMGIVIGEFESFSPKDGVTISVVKEYNNTAFVFKAEMQDESIEKKLVIRKNGNDRLYDFRMFAKEVYNKINE